MVEVGLRLTSPGVGEQPPKPMETFSCPANKILITGCECSAALLCCAPPHLLGHSRGGQVPPSQGEEGSRVGESVELFPQLHAEQVP